MPSTAITTVVAASVTTCLTAGVVWLGSALAIATPSTCTSAPGSPPSSEVVLEFVALFFVVPWFSAVMARGLLLYCSQYHRSVPFIRTPQILRNLADVGLVFGAAPRGVHRAA